MSRTKIVLLLVFAALFALEPVVHTHPLALGGPASSSPCAACASHTARITPPAPAVAAPQTVAYTLTVRTGEATCAAAPLSVPSRAPPAA